MRLFEIMDTLERDQRKRRKVTADLSKQRHRVYLGRPNDQLGKLAKQIIRDTIGDDWEPLR